MPRSGSLFRGIKRPLARPVVSLVLGALLIGDACALCDSKDRWDSLAGSWMASRVSGQTPPPPEWRYETSYAHWPGGDPLVFDSWDQAAYLIANDGGHTLLMTFKAWPPDRRSVWAVTHEHRRYTIDLSLGADLTAAQQGDARRRMVDLLVAGGRVPPGIRAALAQSDVKRTEHFAAAYLHNAAVLLLLGAFVLSLSWVPPSLRRRRTARAVARGRCPSCGYSLLGLGEPVCPECGGPLPALSRGGDTPAHH